MKTKSFILILSVLAITLSSCGNKEATTEATTVSKIIVKDEPVVKNTDFANPANILGSNFGNFFIAMIRTQNYDMALKFTSKRSIDKLGADKVKELYKNFNFNYKLVQKSESKDGDVTTIVYSTKEFATNKLKKITMTVENDSTKIILQDSGIFK